MGGLLWMCSGFVPAEQSWVFSVFPPVWVQHVLITVSSTTERQSSPFFVKTYSDSRLHIWIPFSASTFHTEKYRHPV